MIKIYLGIIVFVAFFVMIMLLLKMFMPKSKRCIICNITTKKNIDVCEVCQVLNSFGDEKNSN